METVISAQDLKKEFKVRTQNGFIKGLLKPDFKIVKAVNGITFNIQRGEAVAFLGPNGAGKTTTTKMMTGLICPTSGNISVLHFTPFDRNRSFLKRIGLVMGNKAGLNWDLTARQSFDLLREIYGISLSDYNNRLEELTELLDVTDHLDTQLRRLSLGERMKLEIIGAILHKPELLFLDEPTIGLDILTKKNIRLFLRKIQKEFKTTLILTSHDMDDVEQVCDRVLVINKGLKVYDDTLISLTSQYQNTRYVRCIFENLPHQDDFIGLGEIIEKDEDSYLFKSSADNLIPLLTKTTNNPDLRDIKIESVPLEEIIGEIFTRR